MEESEQEEQGKREEPPRKASRTKGPSLRERRQSAGVSHLPSSILPSELNLSCSKLSDANESAWEDNNVFQSGAEDSSPVRPSPARRQPKTRTGPPPVTRRVSTRSSLSAPPQLQPPVTRSSTRERESLPPLSIEPQAHTDVPSSPAFAPRLPTSVSVPAGGLKAFDPPTHRIRKSMAAAEASAIVDAVESSEEDEEETQKAANAPDQSRGAEDVEGLVESAGQDSIISETTEEDQSYEQIDEPVDYDTAVAKRIASIGQDVASGKALVQRADVRPPPIVPLWFAVLGGFALSLFVAVIAGYKVESSSIGWCDTGSNTNSIIAEREVERAARYECAERLYLNSTLGVVGMIEPVHGAANKQEVIDGLMGGECTPLPLLPIPHPHACTPCPEHATCTPPYEITCDPTYILKPHPLAAIPGLRQIASGLPGFGAVAFPPQCVEDDARKRKVSGVAKGIATYLETVKGERVCEGASPGGKAVDGGEPRKFGIKVQDLGELVLREIKVRL